MHMCICACVCMYVCLKAVPHTHQVVWPSLAVIGGLDTGLCLGRLCQVGDDDEKGTVVSTPDSDQKVTIQDQVTTSTAQVKKRSVFL